MGNTWSLDYPFCSSQNKELNIRSLMKRLTLWVGLTPFLGISARQWVRVLRQNNFSVDLVYAHRAILLSVGSLINSLLGLIESMIYGRQIREMSVNDSPLFVLGHWRSGTTHLFNLISRDSINFAYPNTYQVCNPSTFLTTEFVASRLLSGILPATRPMDNMAMTFQLPQEDELALCLLSLKSPYLGFCFPRNVEKLGKYLTFRNLASNEVNTWKEAFDLFMRKVSLRTGGERALVLKSPTHTARIKQLLEIYPKARFVHIHRDPYAVFSSYQHFHNTATRYIYLQKPDRNAIDEQILTSYSTLFDAYFEDISLIPKGQFHEIRFENLENDPIKELKQMYESLTIPDFEKARPLQESYVDGLKDYKKNTFSEIDPTVREQINSRWKRSFDTWGYKQQ